MNNRFVSPNVDLPAPAHDADLSDLQAASASRRDNKPIREESHTAIDTTQLPLSSSGAKDPLQQLSITPDKRSSLKARVHRAPSTSRDLEVRIKEGRTASDNWGARKATQPGIFSNPYYPYRGGPITRLIIFLANLLKAIELLLLQGLNNGVAVEQTVVPPSPDEQQYTEQPRTSSAQEESLSLVTASSSDDENDE